MNRWFTVLIVICISLLTSCMKDPFNFTEEQPFDNTAEAAKTIVVPSYSETGANTFGCLINGKPWTNFGKHYETHVLTELKDNRLRAYVGMTWGYAPNDSVFATGGNLTIITNGKTTRDDYMDLTLKKRGLLTGSRTLSASNYVDFLEYGNHMTWAFSDIYCTSPRSPLKVVVRKDFTSGKSHIVSGTFEGFIYGNGGLSRTDSLLVTQGVFDIDLSTIAPYYE